MRDAPRLLAQTVDQFGVTDPVQQDDVHPLRPFSRSIVHLVEGHAILPPEVDIGFDAPLLNSYGCIASVDYITGLYSAMKLVFLHLGRLIQDLGFWSAFEVGQLYVPNSLVQVSSIMPQKRNPVPIEHLRHLASVTAFRCDMVVNTMHNTPFTDMNDSEGEVQQAISVVKKRTGGHERTIRPLALGVGGVRIGEPLRRFRGVLTGVPYDRDEGPSEPLPK